MTKKKNIAIVVQRYGAELIGGAEAHARMLAEAFVRQRDSDVTVFTSKAKDYRTWANEFRGESEQVNGVTVKRFGVLTRRWPMFGLLSRICFAGIRRLSVESGLRLLIESIWVRAQGPWCPGLVRELRREAKRFDAIIWFTYLYYPTLQGTREVSHPRKIMIPTAHREFPFGFVLTRKALSSVHELWINSRTEQNLIEEYHQELSCLKKIVGIGIESDIYEASSFEPRKKRYESQSKIAQERPYLLYLGRVSRGKGVDLLMEIFCSIAMHQDVELRLAGVVEDDLDKIESPNIKVLGAISENEKIEQLRNCLALVNPSPLESLSLVVLEAAAAGVPMLLRKSCEIFRDYAKNLKTVFLFDAKEDFLQGLTEINAKDWGHGDGSAALNEAKTWVDTHYSWKAVLSKIS